ncbi:MAG: energy transducer TonB [Terriglobales bacterium]
MGKLKSFPETAPSHGTIGRQPSCVRTAGRVVAVFGLMIAFAWAAQVQTPLSGIYEPSPAYTAAARKAGVNGTVILLGVIGPDGRVHNLHVILPLPLGLAGC